MNGQIEASPAQTTEYTLTVTGPGGTASATLTVEVLIPVVDPVPTITSFTVDSSTVTMGQTAHLTYQTANATAVTITPELSLGVLPTSGSVRIFPQANTTYVLSATGPGGTTSASVNVLVLQAAMAPPKIWLLSGWNRPNDDAKTFVSSFEIWATGTSPTFSDKLKTDCVGLSLLQEGPALQSGGQADSDIVLTAPAMSQPTSCSVQLIRASDGAESNTIQIDLDWVVYDLRVSTADINGHLRYSISADANSPFTIFETLLGSSGTSNRWYFDGMTDAAGSAVFTDPTYATHQSGFWRALLRQGHHALIIEIYDFAPT